MKQWFPKNATIKQTMKQNHIFRIIIPASWVVILFSFALLNAKTLKEKVDDVTKIYDIIRKSKLADDTDR